MKNIREQIIIALKTIDKFKYLDNTEEVFDHCNYEVQISEELNQHIKEHSYSTILQKQLTDIYRLGFVSILGLKHPYEPCDIYSSIDQILNGSMTSKRFKNKESHLTGKNIYHSHHSQSFYSMFNCIRFFKQQYQNDKDVWKRLEQIQKEHPGSENIMAIFANEVLLESLACKNKTGEWIVYQMINGRFHFICLYVHDVNDTHDENLFSLIKECLL